MDNKRLDQIVQLLKTDENKGMKFAQTHQQLRAAGYSEPEIVAALYRYPYDGNPNPKITDNPMTAFFAKDPKAADKVARSLLNEIAVDEAGKAVVNTLASEAAARMGDRQASYYYQVQASDDIGYPYFRIMFAVIILGILSFKFPRLLLVYGILLGGATVYFIYLLAKKLLAARRLH